MQKEEYLIKNACYSVTKYYLCKQNNKRSLLGRKQRSQVARSFPNRYLFSFTNKVTSLFSISCILRIILACKTAAFGMQNNRFSNTLITRMLGKIYRVKKYLHILLSADLPDSSSYSTVYLLSISLNSTGKITSFFTAFPSTIAGFHLGISLITRIASRSNRGSTL